MTAVACFWAASCAHDWDAVDPRLGDSTSTATAGAGATGGAGSGGNASGGMLGGGGSTGGNDCSGAGGSSACTASTCLGIDTDCRKRVCLGGACAFADEPPETACTGGVCDGAGSCVECLYDSHCPGSEQCDGVTCAAPSCFDNVKNGSETAVDCGGADCAPCANDETCLSDGDCISGDCQPTAPTMTCQPCTSCSSGYFCPQASGPQVCMPKKIAGDVCSSNAECQGSCADGVCCESPCEGSCRSCRAMDTGGENGSCLPIAVCLDPDDECFGDESCDGNGSCPSCNMPQPAPGGECPTVCNGGCTGPNNETCVISSFSGNAISCPEGFNCEVSCMGEGSCENATVTCPPNHLCTVSCAGKEACVDMTLNCGEGGPCHLECASGDDVCEDAEVNCGDEACTSNCNDAPTLNCNGSCDCLPC